MRSLMLINTCPVIGLIKRFLIYFVCDRDAFLKPAGSAQKRAMFSQAFEPFASWLRRNDGRNVEQWWSYENTQLVHNITFHRPYRKKLFWCEVTKPCRYSCTNLRRTVRHNFALNARNSVHVCNSAETTFKISRKKLLCWWNVLELKESCCDRINQMFSPSWDFTIIYLVVV